jgi:hypothetical protein
MAISDLFFSKYGDFGAFFFPPKKKKPFVHSTLDYYLDISSIKEHWLYY